MVFSKLNSNNSIASVAHICCLYILFAAVEGWIQYGDFRRRCLWIFGGLLTGTAYLLFPGRMDTSAMSVLAFLVPASVEFYAALGARKRPWVWLIATTSLYGLVPKWAPLLDAATTKVMTFASASRPTSFGFPHEVPYVAAFIGFILTTRATVGSFIASRVEPELEVGQDATHASP